ncbi:receptor-like protein 2 [Cornus florida]|uniref:receptor-like protein 2 n=1 Tax=Cornus florida TaxID=4283 RepID=UPI00289E948F|nr:receptor-like protein 2 [Cornus florida]
MDSSMTTSTKFLLAFVIIATTISIKGLCALNSDVVCIESERQALLIRFKRHLKDPSNRLLSWTIQQDCCKWAGVVCNNLTGHVQKLHLRALPSDYEDPFSRELNLGLKVGCLRYLNLSLAGFDGVIPHQLRNFSRLRYLILGYNYYLESATGHEWGKLEQNMLLAAARVLDISGSSLSSLLRDWFFNTKGLVSLNLRDNSLRSPIPNGLLNISSTLVHLDLSYNDLNCTIPTWLYSFKRLESLHLGFNSLQGVISSELQNLCNLKAIGLGENRFCGKVSLSI